MLLLEEELWPEKPPLLLLGALLREGEKVRLGVEKLLLEELLLRICGATLPLLCVRLPTVERVLLSRLLPMNPLLLPMLRGLLERVPISLWLRLLGRLLMEPRLISL